MSWTAERIERFLVQFFAHPNEITLADVSTGSSPRARLLGPFVNHLREGAGTIGRMVLPCRRGGRTQSISWYGLAASAAEARHLSEELDAFCGASWTNFRGRRAQLDLSDPVEAAVAEFTGGYAFRFAGRDSSRSAVLDVHGALELLLSHWRSRPLVACHVVRSTGRILREFHQCVVLGDRPAAEAALEELRREARLDARNLAFLRVVLEDALGTPEVVVQRAMDIMQPPRPPRVTEAVVRALYRLFLHRHELSGDTEGATTAFHQFVKGPFGPVLLGRPTARSLEGMKLRAVELAAGEPGAMPAGWHEHLGITHADRAWVDALLARAPAGTAAVTPTLEAAAAAFSRGAYQDAFDLALALDRNEGRRSRVLLLAAAGLRTLEAAAGASDAWFALEPTARELLRDDALVRQALIQLEIELPSSASMERPAPTAPSAQAHVDPSPQHAWPSPTDWLAWIERLYANPSWPGAGVAAADAVEAWSHADLSSRPEAVQRLADRLGELPTAAQLPLGDALPHLLDWLLRDPDRPRQAFVPLFDVLADVVPILGTGGKRDLELLSQIVELRLQTGSDAASHRTLLDAITTAWENRSSPDCLDAVIDLLDVLGYHACPKDSRERRAGLLRQVVTDACYFSRQPASTQWARLRALGRQFLSAAEFDAWLRNLGRDETVNAAWDSTTSLWAALTGKVVGIVSIERRPALGVKDFIERHAPSAEVELNHEKDGSSLLEGITRRSDVLVLVVRATSHAVSDFVRRHRIATRGEDDTVVPVGKSVSSILRAIEETLPKLVSSSKQVGR